MNIGESRAKRSKSLGHRLTKRFAALGASVVMTMRIFGEHPQGRLRRPHVIEQVYEDTCVGLFDSREIAGKRYVLTLPLPTEPSMQRREVQIGLN